MAQGGAVTAPGEKPRRAEPATPSDAGSTLDPNDGIGLEWRYKKETLYTDLRKADIIDGRRVCRVRVRSYRGTDIEAMHWYARLTPSSPAIRSREQPGILLGGFCGGPPGPGTLDAVRVLTAVEYDARGRALGKTGDTTSRFNSEKSARKAAVEMFRKLFPGGWVLVEGDECEYVENPVVLAISGSDTKTGETL